MEEFIKRITNTKTVLALAGAVLLILKELGLQLDNEYIMEVIKTFSYLLVLLGVFNKEGMETTKWDL